MKNMKNKKFHWKHLEINIYSRLKVIFVIDI